MRVFNHKPPPHGVETPITGHLRDFALDPEKYTAMQFFQCGKLKIMRIANILW